MACRGGEGSETAASVRRFWIVHAVFDFLTAWAFSVMIFLGEACLGGGEMEAEWVNCEQV